MKIHPGNSVGRDGSGTRTLCAEETLEVAGSSPARGAEWEERARFWRRRAMTYRAALEELSAMPVLLAGLDDVQAYKAERCFNVLDQYEDDDATPHKSNEQEK